VLKESKALGLTRHVLSATAWPQRCRCSAGCLIGETVINGQVTYGWLFGGGVLLWTEEGQLLRKLSGHTDRLARVAFHPMGHHLVSAAQGSESVGLARRVIWATACPRARQRWMRCSVGCSFLGEHLNDGRVTYGRSRCCAVLWIVGGQLLRKLTGHSNGLACCIASLWGTIWWVWRA
jgi:hypothetical protein